MKCINCKYMKEAHDGLYWCTNDESEHFHDYTGLRCENECEVRDKRLFKMVVEEE